MIFQLAAGTYIFPRANLSGKTERTKAPRNQTRDSNAARRGRGSIRPLEASLEKIVERREREREREKESSCIRRMVVIDGAQTRVQRDRERART